MSDLFGNLEESFREHWRDMPEFIQEDLTPHRVINVRFRNDADVEAFAQLLNQKISPKQKALWFPEALHRKASHLRYVDES
jgi:hypothetical protein